MNNDDIIISVGIICFKLDKSIYNIFMTQMVINRNMISSITMDKLTLDTSFLNKYNKLIQFLLVKRRYSFNYIDFIRGKYDMYNINMITKIISYMSREEIKMIQENDFDYLWNNLWKQTAYNKKYLNEMNKSKQKFEYVKKKGYIYIEHIYNTTEWEIPKGKKKYKEKNIECAIREFKEETSLDSNMYKLIDINPIQDIFTGTNMKKYCNIYYCGIYNDHDIDTKNDHTIDNEIDMDRWCNLDELNDLFRPYNINKINILTHIFLYIVNICETYR